MTNLKLRKTTRLYWNDPTSPPPVVPPPPPPPAPTPDAKFTQADVDRILGERLKTSKQNTDKLVADLEALRNSVNLTAAEKASLEDKLTLLGQQHMTDSQRLTADLDKTKKTHAAELEKLQKQAGTWETSFKSLMIENSIREAAAKHRALSSDQMLMLLANQAKVVPMLDDKGEQTGWSVKVPVRGVDKQGVSIVTDVPLLDHVGKMREDKSFQNLFEFEGQGGLGLGNLGKVDGKDINWKNMTPAEYAKNRDKLMKE